MAAERPLFKNSDHDEWALLWWFRKHAIEWVMKDRSKAFVGLHYGPTGRLLYKLKLVRVKPGLKRYD